MIKGSYDELTRIVQTHRCPEHPDQALTCAWHDPDGYVIRCGAGHYPEEVTRQPSLTEAYKQGEDIPEPVASNILKGNQKRAQKPGAPALPMVLGELPKADLATGEALNEAQVQALRRYALKYGLDPYRGHICLMYGQPYFTIDAYLYHARQLGEPYQLRSKPLTKAEREDYQLGEGDHAWLAKVVMDQGAGHFTGLGIVTAGELTEKSKKNPERLRYPVVAAHPWQLAQKRAEWQALRRAFPIGESQEEVSNEGMV